MIIDAILSIGKTLWDVGVDVKGQQQQQRERSADYLNSVAQVLVDAADSLQKREVPHGKCEELFHHAQDFDAVMEGLLDDEQRHALAQRLQETWEIERAFAELEQLKFDQQADAQIILLRKAAGYFRAVSAKLLIGG
ncbi:hypothetical protein LJ739_02800 [Aestuariibacter halophilus]|uniref:Co-chaperone DjlA N-terminal domain-containing protein n=1 Tax=Fluctibacter halophilus TaxID=226011 RepID=A0ABS8G3K5_9ALTE|nr:hypothetical protein [Aestuariibacter halophilus]MCC2615172.1 hypothetical protein [Aestuariibacter halophilus]